MHELLPTRDVYPCMGMHALLLVALCSLQDGLKEKVDRLLQQLAADGIEVREQAADTLVKLGKPALELLRLTRDGSKDASVKSYLVDAVARIERDVRRETFEGGREMGGLKAGLRLADPKKRKFKRDEAIELTIEVLNVSRVARAFVPIDDWSHTLPGISESSTSAQACLEVKQVAGEAPKEAMCIMA